MKCGLSGVSLVSTAGLRSLRSDSAQQTAAPPRSHQPADQQGDAHESRSRKPVQVSSWEPRGPEPQLGKDSVQSAGFLGIFYLFLKSGLKRSLL